MISSKKRTPRAYLWIAGGAMIILLVWLGIRSFRQVTVQSSDPDSRRIEDQFTLQENFSIRLVAKEPDIINPMTLCLDEHGAIYVTESSTYRYGLEGAPSKELLNPIKRIELDANGRPSKVTMVAQGFANPVMGIDIFGNKLYATCLNELFVMDIGPDGQLGNRQLLVKDSADPWNPFGMYRVAVGPDAKLWLAIADHPDSKPVTLTGSDKKVLRLRGQSGGFVRCNLDGSGLELVVQGFRAPFAFDFDPWGHLWAVSNGEGSPNIYVDVIPGMDYGYHSRKVSYAWLAGKTSLAPPVSEMGPGANTVALHYYSSMLPENSWGSIIMANWGSHGANPTNRVLKQFMLTEGGGNNGEGNGKAQLQESKEPFLVSTDSMFRPVSMVMAHDGALYLADWHGRDDESDKTGRIFEIRYTGRDRTGKDRPSVEAIGKMDAAALSKLLEHPNRFTRQQAQLRLVQSGAKALGPLGEIILDKNAFAAANAVWTLTQFNSVEAAKVMRLALKHPDPRIRALGLRQLRQAAGQPLGGLRSVSIGSKDTEFKGTQLLTVEELDAMAAPLVKDPDGEVRVEAALARGSQEAISSGLLAALDIVTDQRLRYQIGFELGRYGEPASLEKLYNASDPALKRMAIIAAETAINEKTALVTTVKHWDLTVADQNEAEKLVQQIQAGKVRPTGAADQLMALEWIAQHPEKPSGPLLEFLSACLREHDYLVQAAALRVAQQDGMHPKEIQSVILGMLQKSSKTYPHIQLEALQLAGSFEDLGKPEDWAAWMKDTSDNAVITTLRALRKRTRQQQFMKALWPDAVAAAGRNAALAEEVRFTFQSAGLPEGDWKKLPASPVRPADKSQLAQLILSGLKTASAQRGRWSFDMTCATCHGARAGEGESRLGPNLSSIGAASQPEYLIESILRPNKVLKTGFQVETIETKDGKVFSGQMETRDQEIIVKRPNMEPLKVPMADVKRRTTSHLSPMPEGLDNTMTVGELADLTAYLLRLKGSNQ